MKITEARISPLPLSFLDPLPQVHICVEGVWTFLFDYFPDEIHFSPEEFVGLTREEAIGLKFKKDKGYLQS